MLKETTADPLGKSFLHRFVQSLVQSLCPTNTMFSFIRLNSRETGSWLRAGIFQLIRDNIAKLCVCRFQDLCDCHYWWNFWLPFARLLWLPGTRLRKSWGLGSQRTTPTYLGSKAHLGNSTLIERTKICITVISNQPKYWGPVHCKVLRYKK